MQYRKYYESCIGRKVLPNHEIHHLDSDRNNNHISNLVELPKKLHSKIHNCELKMSKFIIDINTMRCFSPYDKKNGFNAINDYMEIRSDVYDYEMKRDELLYSNKFKGENYTGKGQGVVLKLLSKIK